MTAEPPADEPRATSGLASRRLFAAALIGRTANEMTPVALVLLALDRGESGAVAGVTVGGLAFSGVISGPFLGAWLDRARRPLRVIGAEQLLGAAGLASLAILIGHVPAAATIVIAAIAGALQPLSTGGMTSLLTGFSADDALPRATSLEAGSFGAASVAGPAVAAIIVGVAGAATAVFVQVALKLLAMTITVSAAERRRPALPRAAQCRARSAPPSPPASTISRPPGRSPRSPSAARSRWPGGAC